MKLIATTAIACFVFYGVLQAQSQQRTDLGEIHGNFQVDVQYYNEDSLIGAPIVPEKILMNNFGNINYTKGDFRAGFRYESYLNALQGFDPGYEGTGVPYRYAAYALEDLDITVGSYYEQFGSGMIFRSYEERGLGIDNAMDGVRLKYNPYKGIYLKGVYGKQRLFFGEGPGIVRGVDAEVNLNELVDSLSTKKSKIILGGSFVSKYQSDRDPIYNLPENVAAYGGRLMFIRDRIILETEYTYKFNDPSTDNGFIYKPGQSFLVNASYSKKGFGLSFGAKAVDNMSFRSDRTQALNNLMINYLPAITKQHTYNLAATLYPYATQPNGEVGLQGDLFYTIKKGTPIGGKYGTTINVNYSWVHGMDSTFLNDLTTSRQGYSNKFGMPGEEVFFKDFNISVKRKFNKKLKAKYTYFNIVYNMDVVQGLVGKGTIFADIHVLDMSYKIKPKHTLRVEGQYLRTNQDQQSWVTGLAEYTFSPHWFVAVLDQYNFANTDPNLRIHYLYGSVGYIKGASRFTLSYGRQREGIFCVGGVCRNVPASNGFTLSVTSSF